MMNARSRWSLLAVPVLAAFGCSDPVPLPNQGSVNLQVGGPTSTCPEPGKTYLVGNPAPTDRQSGIPVIDGDSGASITCSVTGNGPYSFSGSIRAATSEHDPIAITFNNGVIGADKQSGTADVGIFTKELADTYSSSTPCTIQVINSNVKPGSLWATFSCSSLTLPPSSVCTSGVPPSQSVVLFQNCAGS